MTDPAPVARWGPTSGHLKLRRRRSTQIATTTMMATQFHDGLPCCQQALSAAARPANSSPDASCSPRSAARAAWQRQQASRSMMQFARFAGTELQHNKERWLGQRWPRASASCSARFRATAACLLHGLAGHHQLEQLRPDVHICEPCFRCESSW